MINWYEMFIVIFVVSGVMAHLFIAYFVAPKTMKKKLIKSLAQETEIQDQIMNMIIENVFKEREFRDEKGNIIKMSGIELLTKFGINKLMQTMHGYQSNFEKESENLIKESLASDNPLLSLLIPMIPKKYLWIINLLNSYFKNYTQNIGEIEKYYSGGEKYK